ncbi:hypothetical protein D3C83_188700 [compost metagenome]
MLHPQVIHQRKNSDQQQDGNGGVDAEFRGAAAHSLTNLVRFENQRNHEKNRAGHDHAGLIIRPGLADEP